MERLFNSIGTFFCRVFPGNVDAVLQDIETSGETLAQIQERNKAVRQANAERIKSLVDDNAERLGEEAKCEAAVADIKYLLRTVRTGK